MPDKPKRKRTQSDKRLKKRGAAKIPPEIIQKAEEISAKTGIDLKYSINVAKGNTTVASVLKELMLKEKANKLAEKHGIPKSQAMEVVMGKFSVEDAILIVEMYKSPAWRPDHSILIELNKSGEKGLFFTFREQPFTAGVEKTTKYDCWLAREGADSEEYQKHELLMAALPHAGEELKKHISFDEEVKQLGLGPSTSYRDRYRSKKRLLFLYHRDEIKTRVTLRDGSVLDGTIGWFGKWEFLLQISPGCEVVVFRHAMHNLEGLNQNGSLNKNPESPTQESIPPKDAPEKTGAMNKQSASKSVKKQIKPSKKQKKKPKKRK